MNDKVEKLAAYTSQAIPKFTLNSTVQQGQAVLQVTQNAEGPIWGYVEAFADRPWNEAFLVDEEDGPIFNFRVVPYKRLDTGALLFEDALDPGTIDVDALEVLSIDVNRSDSRVRQLLLGCRPALGSWTATPESPPDPWRTRRSIRTFPNNNPTLYGGADDAARNQPYPDDVPGPATSAPAAQRPQINTDTVTWFKLRATQLNAMNVNNAL